MRWHSQMLFRPEFSPRPFCYSIRPDAAPNRCPEGTIAIVGGGGDRAPAHTTVRHVLPEEAPLMSCRINAGTSVAIGGDRYVRTWAKHTHTHRLLLLAPLTLHTHRQAAAGTADLAQP